MIDDDDEQELTPEEFAQMLRDATPEELGFIKQSMAERWKETKKLPSLRKLLKAKRIVCNNKPIEWNVEVKKEPS